MPVPVLKPVVREGPFWLRAGAVWRQLAGNFEQSGFSFEWHEMEPGTAVNWAGSFHPSSIEICLNLQGAGWVAATDRERMDFGPETAGFFATNGRPLKGERLREQRHQFLSLEFSIPFLKHRLAQHTADLHLLIRRCFEPESAVAVLSRVSPLTHRHRDLLNSLLRPPVLRAAQKLWYESKALEFASEFFFGPGETEPLCTRAQHLAAERVVKAKTLLAANLCDPPSLEELGRQVGCSSFYLSRTFSQETGLTISQWLRRARLERAAELLKGGKHNVTEAAFEVGYSSLSHFSQAFHEMFGCCPGLYPVRTTAQKAC